LVGVAFAGNNMARARIAVIDIASTLLSNKEELAKNGPGEKAKLLANADEIAKGLAEIEVGLDEVSKQEDDDSNDEDDEEDPDEETPEDKVEAKKKKWEKRRLKYKKYCDKGKYEKLEKAHKKQVAKLEKAKEKGKPQVYIDYKQYKADFTAQLIKAAMLIHNMKKAGLM